MFEEPEAAATQLAESLARYRGSHPLVLAVARAAFRVGQKVASIVDGDFDVALVGIVGAQYNVRYAVGAIDESGSEFTPAAAKGEAANAYLDKERRSLLRNLQERRSLYTPNRKRLAAAGRVVIVVDDAILTGTSMITALRALREEGPDRLIGAVPVAARAGLEAVRPYADELVCLSSPLGFRDVGQAYRQRPLISDADIASALSARPS